MPQTEPSPPRFDHFVAELLQRHDGVFLGELHNHPELRQATAKLLPYFKAHGVQTLSVELPQNIVDEMKVIADRDQLKRHWPRASDQMHGYFEVVKAAQRMGIRVIGHETKWPKMLEEALRSEQKDEGVVSAGRSLWAGSEAGMKLRDDFAASHIRANRKGKFLVLGGWNHSGNFTEADMDAPDRETDYGYVKSQDTSSRYEGLDSKLGIPSIDYRKMNRNDLPGAMSKASGKFSTYEVALPEGGLGNFYPCGPRGTRNVR